MVIGCISNFNEFKGHLGLLDAFALMRARGPRLPLKLLLAGEGPTEPAIRARMAKLGVERDVLMVGHSSEVSRQFALSDLVVVPSRTEGFSNTLVQAMASARPVVAFRVGGNPEAIDHGRTGLLVEAGNILRLAETMHDLLQDPERGPRMGEAARKVACERFSSPKLRQRAQDLMLRTFAPRPR